MRIKSFAKINLGLEVTGKRPDGYHDILTLFQAIDLADILDFTLLDEESILLSGDDPSIPWDETNLIFKAARLLKERFRAPQGVEIKVQKRIPHGKGLGGGSSNAAMTLHVLNSLWALRLTKGELVEIAKELGADVPFFLEGGFCLGRERGDSLVPLPDLPQLFCLLAFPPFPISTAEVYGRLGFTPPLTSDGNDSKILRFLETRDFGLLENRLEETVFRLYPQLLTIKSSLLSQGSELSLVSGTGSAVFGLFRDKERAERGRKELEKTLKTCLAGTIPRDMYWRRIGAGV
jgi:4-diphosphocytidyl-2-C-methyl-D-erythritol kinase